MENKFYYFAEACQRAIELRDRTMIHYSVAHDTVNNMFEVIAFHKSGKKLANFYYRS